ncbi:P-loop containing nucleoside triphosphate hydrolase protein [Gloeopeniophorella convolvens]|nr:P-loop containing nucleoside triphosphate hydrolase protein [Gloeopeniophorella convolvens]
MLSFSSDTCIIPIQGPPGTGKTTVIATYVLSAIEAEQKGIWLMAQSNVAVKNIAEKLAKLNFYNFKLLVSKDFHFECTQVILCTLSMISSKRLQSSGLMRLVPISNVVIDEASQIEIGQYVPLFKSFGHSLRKMCFIGDDRQYRMPPQIGEFISKEVYEGKLNSYPQHPVKAATTACHFVDVPGLEKLDSNGKSYLNDEEVAAAMLLARHLEEEGTPYRLITPYDAQRSALEHALQDAELDWHDKCFNVDSFQGNEDHVIVISVVRTKALGFLSSVRRTNVMLTRCQRGMYILSSRAFLAGKGADSLVGKMAAELGTRPGAWLTRADLEAAKFE